MTCDYLRGQFDSKAFDLGFAIGVLTCRALLFEPSDARADDLVDGVHVDGLAGAGRITLMATGVHIQTLADDPQITLMSINARAEVAE